MSEHNLEARIRRLEDIDDIKNIITKYGYYIDMQQWEAVIDLYADDAVAEMSYPGTALPNAGVFIGRQQIADGFYRGWEVGFGKRWTAHNIVMPLVEVDGDWAYGTWYLLAMTMYTKDEDKMAYWSHAKFNHVFQRIGDKWFIKRERIIFSLRTPYDQGWHKEGFFSPIQPGEPQRHHNLPKL